MFWHSKLKYYLYLLYIFLFVKPECLFSDLIIMLHREFACHICRISVASYETYQNHLRGKDHIKRVNNQTKYDNEQEF